MRYSEIGKDVHGLIGGHTHWWGGEGGGAGRLKGEVAGALVCQRELEKAREIPLVCFHCMVALAKAPRWERRNIPFFFFVSGPSTGWGIPRVKRWVSRGQRRFNTLVQARHSSCEFKTCLPRALLWARMSDRER